MRITSDAIVLVLDDEWPTVVYCYCRIFKCVDGDESVVFFVFNVHEHSCYYFFRECQVPPELEFCGVTPARQQRAVAKCQCCWRSWYEESDWCLKFIVKSASNTCRMNSSSSCIDSLMGKSVLLMFTIRTAVFRAKLTSLTFLPESIVNCFLSIRAMMFLNSWEDDARRRLFVCSANASNV